MSPRIFFSGRSGRVAFGAALALLLFAGAYAGDPLEPARDEFLHAYAQPGTLGTDSDALQAYPLYSYLVSKRIQHVLEQTAEIPAPGDEQARAFLQAHEFEPVGRDLRATWLRSLARRQDWVTYIKEYRRETADAPLRCYFLQARIAQQRPDAPMDPEISTDLLAQWLAPRQLPQECEPVFGWARQNGIVREEHIEQRLRLLLENDQGEFARMIAAQLPAERAAPFLQWADLLQRPEREIDALIAAQGKPVDPAALLAGWTKLARRNSRSALARYDRLLAARPPEGGDASAFALPLALSLAWDREPQALSYFARVSAEKLDDPALAWKARAALWADDWDQARDAIESMSPVQRGEARWRYWAARAAEHAGDAHAAHQLYESLQPDDNYYSAIAAARLKHKAEPHPRALSANAGQLDEIAAQPALVRARELFLCQLRAEALTEWLHGTGALPPELRKQAVALAAKWNWYDVAVATATQQKVFNDYALLYPRPYDEEVHPAAKRARVPDEVVYGIIRQESLFRPDARSSADALGLMQLQIGTARRTARQSKRRLPTSADLFDPAVNVALGAAHLRELLDRFGGQPAVALAAYNAGPNSAQRWLPPRATDADIWIENIPYNETREYVQRVHWHAVVFAWLKSGKAQDTRSWLKPVKPVVAKGKRAD